MLQSTWRRPGSPAWLAIGLVILVPALAEAQLFPNRTIRREKPSCATEPPFNKTVRRDYFGYYPTCWSKFPAGWACPCPNPELPNAAASFAKMPRDKSRVPSSGEDMGPGDEESPPDPDTGMRGNAPGEGPNVPLPESGRSPFELDTNPTPRPPTPPPTRPADPFTTPDPSTPGPANPRSTPPGNRPSGPSSLLEMPPIPSPTTTASSVESNRQPGSIVMSPDATLASDTSSLRPDLGPLPSAPTPAPFTPGTSATVAETEPTLGVPAPAQAPKRRSLLGALFGRGNTSTR
jgi:hypothetical protein